MQVLREKRRKAAEADPASAAAQQLKAQRDAAAATRTVRWEKERKEALADPESDAAERLKAKRDVDDKAATA